MRDTTSAKIVSLASTDPDIPTLSRVKRTLMSAEMPYLKRAEVLRGYAETIVDQVEFLTEQLGNMPEVPLDVLDRYERVLVAAHVGNQQRVSKMSDRMLMELEG